MFHLNLVGLSREEKGRSWKVEEREGKGRGLVATRQLEVQGGTIQLVKLICRVELSFPKFCNFIHSVFIHHVTLYIL